MIAISPDQMIGKIFLQTHFSFTTRGGMSI